MRTFKLLIIFILLYLAIPFSQSVSAQMVPGFWSGSPFVAHYDVAVIPNHTLFEKQKPNEVCPISGEKVNQKVFTKINGKKIYFCCKNCIEPFLQK
jgi:YHS domain-containing protein